MTEAADDRPVHSEPARSFASVWTLVAVLLVGVAIDAALGGAAAHALGWAIAFVLIIGVQTLLVYAARSTRSLTVTDSEVRVGDETVSRAQIAGVLPGLDRDASVLGWPNGIPRMTSGLTVRLDDGDTLVIPTRDPARLQRTLGLGTASPAARASVRPATDDDLPLLAEIDERAEIVFRLAGYDLPEIPFADDPADAIAIFVVDDPPVGFVRVDEVDGLAHIAEIAVLPGAMKHGHGSRLLEHTCEWAKEHGYAAVTLTTYADVPWNGPWYRSRGFVGIEAGTPALQAIRKREAELGLDDVGPRIAMRRDL